jgi:hypothetical protein
LLHLNQIIVQGSNAPFLLAVISCYQVEIQFSVFDCIIDEFLANLDLLEDFSILLHKVSICRGLSRSECGVVIFDACESLFDLVNKLDVWSLVYRVHLGNTLSENEASLFRYFLKIR